MKKLDCCARVVLLGLSMSPLVLLAQQDAPATEVRRHIDVPAPLGGLTPQLTSSPEIGSGTVLTGGIALNAIYDDNATAPNGGQTAHYQYSVQPNVGIQNLGRETQWLLNYSGGITFDQSARQEDLFTRTASADLRHNFSKRLAAEAREEYLVSNSPFAQIGTTGSLPLLAGPGELSIFAIPPTATRTASVSLASVSYQLSVHSGIGVNGNFSTQNFRDVITPSGINGSLIDTRTAAGRAFFVDRISRRQTIGIEYQFEDLDFQGGLARATDHTLFAFDEISIRDNMKLSLFAGPESSHIHNLLVLNGDLSRSVVPALSDQLSWAGGALYTWQGEHSGFRASVSRGVGDGGGFLGAVRVTTGMVDLHRQITARWNVVLGTSYSDGRVLDSSANGTGDRITSIEGHAGVERRITRNITIHGQYAHVNLPHGGVFSQSVRANHNQVEIGLQYNFHRTLSQ